MLIGIGKSVHKARDHFWSGVWWTDFLRHQNERRLALALERFGENSMPVRELTERHRRLENGCKYWRPSDPDVLRVLEASERAGASRADLRLLALNRDIYRHGDKVKVRRGWLLNFLAWATFGVVFAGWLMLACLFAFSPTDLSIRVLGITAVTLFYWFAWPGLGLYTTRPLGAVARSGETIEHVAERHHIRNASVSTIEAARHSRICSKLLPDDSAHWPSREATQSAVPPQHSTQTLTASTPPDRSEANFDV